MQWTSHFFEVVIVASCNEYLSLQKKKKKKKASSCHMFLGFCEPVSSELGIKAPLRVLVDDRLLVQRSKRPQLHCFSFDLLSIHLLTKDVRVPLQLLQSHVELFGFSTTDVGLTVRIACGKKGHYHSHCSVLTQPCATEEQSDLHGVCLQTRKAALQKDHSLAQAAYQSLDQTDLAPCLQSTLRSS